MPDYLHNRPKTAWKGSEDITLIDDERGIFSVMGTSGKNHGVTFTQP